jgi:branched-chain amino acid transport system permease protein
MELTVKGFTASVLGGLTSLTGALIGGLALGLIEASLAMAVSSGYREAIVMGLLLVVLLTRPEGLLGKHH